MAGLTNGFIDEFLEKVGVSEEYSGCYPVDLMPDRVADSFSMVCNLSTSRQTGSHFVTVVGRERTITYYDSLAFPLVIASPQMYSRLESYGKIIVRGVRRPVQSLLSDFCGLFAIYYVLRNDPSRNASITSNLLPFSNSNLRANDSICVENIDRLMIINRQS